MSAAAGPESLLGAAGRPRLVQMVTISPVGVDRHSHDDSYPDCNRLHMLVGWALTALPPPAPPPWPAGQVLG
jgi:hypothetical protein